MHPFPEKNLKSIRIISKSMPAPIVIACYSADDEELVTGLESIIPDTGYSLADVIAWCKDKRTALLAMSGYKRQPYKTTVINQPADTAARHLDRA